MRICFYWIWKLKFFNFSENQSTLEPYKAALADIENQIKEQSEKIANVKRKIILNEEKINKLIFNIGKNWFYFAFF